jgi:type IV secretory pathway VirB6-like protein
VIRATVSSNETAAAVLGATLISEATAPASGGSGWPLSHADGGAAAGLLGDVAVISTVASWESIAASPRYDMSSYFSFVWGALNHFDLPDMAAAILHASPLLLAPLDAERRPLNASAIASAYQFAKSANPQLAVLGGDAPQGVTARLLNWLQGDRAHM